MVDREWESNGNGFSAIGAKRCCRLDKELNTVKINISRWNQSVECRDSLGAGFRNFDIWLMRC